MGFGPSKYMPGQIKSQPMAELYRNQNPDEEYMRMMQMMDLQAPRALQPMQTETAEAQPQSSPIQAPKDRGMFGRFQGFNPLRFDPDKGVGEGNRLYAIGAMLSGMGSGDPALTANLLEPKLQANRVRVQKRSEEQKAAEEEARRQQMLQQLSGMEGLTPQQRTLIGMGLGTEQAVEQAFASPAAAEYGFQSVPGVGLVKTDPRAGSAEIAMAATPGYERTTLADGVYEYIPGRPETMRKLGDAPAGSPLVAVNTSDGSDGSRPIIGDPPKDYQARYNEETGSYEFEPIPGSDAAREREGAAIKAGTSIRLADEQFELMTTSIDKAIEQADFWSAGLMAQATSGIGSTPARNLRATIDTIVANIGFEKLQEMRETSPAGGALGNVTERELQFLQSVRGSLDQIQDPAQLREVLAQVKQSLSIIHEIRKMNMQSNMSNSGTRIPDGNAMGADAPPLVWNSQKGDFE